MEQVVCEVGVDWGEGKHSFVVRSQTEHYKGEIAADPESVHRWVQTLRERHPEGMILVALEQSRGALIYALLRYAFLVLVPINPRAASAFRESLSLSGAKDDPLDAELILEFVSKHRSKLRPWRPDDSTTRKLRLLVEGRREAVDLRTSIGQMLSAALKQYFPQVLDWFDDATGKLPRAFLSRWSSLQAAKRAYADTIEELVRTHSRKKPEQVAELISKIRSAVNAITFK